jgi:hypothetical protein
VARAEERFGKRPRDGYLSNQDWYCTSPFQLQIVPATALGIGQRFIRFASALEFYRRGAGANVGVVPSCQRAERTPDRFVVSILLDTQHNVVVHRASSGEHSLVPITISTASTDAQVAKLGILGCYPPQLRPALTSSGETPGVVSTRFGTRLFVI